MDSTDTMKKLQSVIDNMNNKKKRNYHKIKYLSNLKIIKI